MAIAASLSSLKARFPRKTAMEEMAHEPAQATHAKPAMAASARADMQTDPRQNRSLLRKALSETKPTKWKSVLRSSTPRLTIGIETIKRSISVCSVSFKKGSHTFLHPADLEADDGEDGEDWDEKQKVDLRWRSG